MKKKPVQQKPKAQPAAEQKPVNYTFFLAGLVILTAILYSNGLHGDILNFDDVEYFAMYPEVKNLSWASITKYFSGYYVLMYQPLPILTFAINYYFSGLDSMPMHLVNLLFHLANIVLVFRFIKELTDKPFLAFVVAALFAIHPMNVEAVTWISARSSSMYTCFYLLALWQYVKYHKSNFNTKHILLAGLFFLLSLLSKAQAVTLPVVLLAIDYFFARKISKGMILEKIPFFILSIIFGIVTISDSGTMKNITNGMMISYSFIDMFFMLCYSVVFYFFKLLVPIQLCAIYVYPPKVDGMLPWMYYAAPLILAGIFYLLWRFRKDRNIIFGAAIFFITISINLQIIPSRLFIVTERYGYFPYIGLMFIIAYVFNKLLSSADEKQKKIAGGYRIVLLAMAAFFIMTVWQRTEVWANDEVFMTDVIAKNPGVPYLCRAYGNRANYYLNNGMVNEAMNDFTEALKLNNKDAQTYYNRAVTYIKLNKLTEAEQDLDSALKYNPKGGLVYSNLAFVKYSKGDKTLAAQYVEKALQLDSNIAEAYNMRSALRFAAQDFTGAEKDLEKAIALKPDFGDAYKNLGIVYLNTNRKGQACDYFQKAQMYGNKDAAGLIQANCK